MTKQIKIEKTEYGIILTETNHNTLKIGHGSVVKNKKSGIKWEVWHADEEDIAVMQYSSSRPRSFRIKTELFNKSWELL